MKFTRKILLQFKKRSLEKKLTPFGLYSRVLIASQLCFYPKLWIMGDQTRLINIIKLYRQCQGRKLALKSRELDGHPFS